MADKDISDTLSRITTKDVGESILWASVGWDLTPPQFPVQLTQVF